MYGVSLRSEWQLPYDEGPSFTLPRIELSTASRPRFLKASRWAKNESQWGRWAQYCELPDRTEYLRWTNLFEFLVSADGGRIIGRALAGGSTEAFHTYLLGQVLSHSLIKLGFEPLHATVVEIDGAGVGFLGGSGRGKSTLGAEFLRAGARLLTDDLLVVKPNPGGSGFLAFPGVPRIKLFPDMARRLLGARSRGARMNPLTQKLVVPLSRTDVVQNPIPLRHLYILRPPRYQSAPTVKRIAIRRLFRRRAFLELVRNTYNRDVVEPGRLLRQLRLNTDLAATVPLQLLCFPRRSASLTAVRTAVLRDLERNHAG